MKLCNRYSFNLDCRWTELRAFHFIVSACFVLNSLSACGQSIGTFCFSVSHGSYRFSVAKFPNFPVIE